MESLFAILLGGAFAYIGLKKKFFLMWSMLFNLFVSIFLGIMLLPLISRLTPDIGQNGYFLSATMFVLTALFFFTLNFIVKMYVISSNSGVFPVIFDRIGAGCLGFLFGYIICCFVFFVLSVMPIAKHPVMTNVFGKEGFGALSSRPVKKMCRLVGSASWQCYPDKSDKVINWLIMISEKQEEPELKSTRTGIEKELTGKEPIAE